MSGDLEVAGAGKGATMVRIGTGLFGSNGRRTTSEQVATGPPTFVSDEIH